MPQFAANLSMLYNELDFLDRFEAAAADGFAAVEYLFPYDFDKRELAARLTANGLRQVLFNAPPGNWNAGERGLACLPGRRAEFRDGIAKALDYAEALACPRLHVMAGLIPDGMSRPELQAGYIANLQWAAGEAAKAGCDVLIEPINLRDIPGFFLNRQDHAHHIVEQVGAVNCKVQMDLYHCQIVEGDLAAKLRQYLPTGRVGHIQIAGVPQRHEPDLGEVNYAYLFDVIDELSKGAESKGEKSIGAEGDAAKGNGWDGWVGCEYRPQRGAVPRGTSAGLDWFRSLPTR